MTSDENKIVVRMALPGLREEDVHAKVRADFPAVTLPGQSSNPVQNIAVKEKAIITG